jgi:hypothetical protein
MTILGACFLLLGAGFLLFKAVVPDADHGWSSLPAIDFLFIAGFLLCATGLGIGYAYRSWTMDADEFAEWWIAQQWFGASTEFWIELFTKEYYLWSTRLLSPLLAGMTLVMLSVVTGAMVGGRTPP